VKDFLGYHSEWNLGSPGGWDYQRITQVIGKAVWKRINDCRPVGVDLDFDHPLLYPVEGFLGMLVEAHRLMAGSNPGLVAVIAEEETLEDVTENRNLAERLDGIEGITGALMAPHELELSGGRVCYRGEPLSVGFVDFNTDVLLKLHRSHDLSPLLQAVREGRIVNPRGTEPINIKSMFEVLTDLEAGRFSASSVARTPWTRRFFERQTTGPKGEAIGDLMEWTRSNWENLVLKPERGYSGIGVRVGGVNPDADEAIGLAVEKGSYIVQEKIPLNLWAEDNVVYDSEKKTAALERYQTDFRCLFGRDGIFGFLVRFGGVPTNVGSGGGVQPLAILRSDISVAEAVKRVNGAVAEMDAGELGAIVDMQKALAVEHRFTYLLGPIRIALRPRIVTQDQLSALATYTDAIWDDCRELERMWLQNELGAMIDIEEEELEIARLQPWGGSPALFASDGLFSFGAHPED
jgi:hypothetical protein